MRCGWAARRTGDGWSEPSPVHRDGWEINGSAAQSVMALLLLGGLLTLTLWYWARGEASPGDVTFGVTHVMTTNGVRSAILNADTAVQLDSGRRWDLRFRSGETLSLPEGEEAAKAARAASRGTTRSPPTSGCAAATCVRPRARGDAR